MLRTILSIRSRIEGEEDLTRAAIEENTFVSEASTATAASDYGTNR